MKKNIKPTLSNNEREITINNCYGGFGLSHQAINALWKIHLSGTKVNGLNIYDPLLDIFYNFNNNILNDILMY